jgi:hypothetical protein
MTLSVMTDMRYFMLILLILVVGNVRCLYPMDTHHAAWSV